MITQSFPNSRQRNSELPAETWCSCLWVTHNCFLYSLFKIWCQYLGNGGLTERSSSSILPFRLNLFLTSPLVGADFYKLRLFLHLFIRQSTQMSTGIDKFFLLWKVFNQITCKNMDLKHISPTMYRDFIIITCIYYENGWHSRIFCCNVQFLDYFRYTFFKQGRRWKYETLKVGKYENLKYKNYTNDFIINHLVHLKIKS